MFRQISYIAKGIPAQSVTYDFCSSITRLFEGGCKLQSVTYAGFYAVSRSRTNFVLAAKAPPTFGKPVKRASEICDNVTAGKLCCHPKHDILKVKFKTRHVRRRSTLGGIGRRSLPAPVADVALALRL